MIFILKDNRRLLVAGSIGLSVLIAIAWFGTGWFTIYAQSVSRIGKDRVFSTLSVSRGEVSLSLLIDTNSASGWLGHRGVGLDRVPSGPRWILSPLVQRSVYGSSLVETAYTLPIGLFAILSCTGSVILYRYRSRQCNGGCPCGYPRDGLVSGCQCPECGRGGTALRP